MTFPLFLFLAGSLLLAIIIALFWIKDELRNPTLARMAYSGLVARLAVIGATFIVLGLLLFSSQLLEQLVE